MCTPIMDLVTLRYNHRENGTFQSENKVKVENSNKLFCFPMAFLFAKAKTEQLRETFLCSNNTYIFFQGCLLSNHRTFKTNFR